jgi:WD40 repeat protein
MKIDDHLWQSQADAATGAEIAVLKGHKDAVTSAAFSPDGTKVVTGSRDRTFRVWDAITGVVTDLVQGHEGAVNSAAFSPDGMRVVTASGDKTARVWDVSTGAEIAVLKGHEDEVNSAAFSSDGTKVVTASDDNTVRVWDLRKLEKGDGFAVACARLGNNTDLTDVRARYRLAKITPICGEFSPLPVDPAKLK